MAYLDRSLHLATGLVGAAKVLESLAIVGGCKRSLEGRARDLEGETAIPGTVHRGRRVIQAAVCKGPSHGIARVDLDRLRLEGVVDDLHRDYITARGATSTAVGGTRTVFGSLTLFLDNFYAESDFGLGRNFGSDGLDHKGLQRLWSEILLELLDGGECAIVFDHKDQFESVIDPLGLGVDRDDLQLDLAGKVCWVIDSQLALYFDPIVFQF